jgi:dienelactone hydrolase
MGKDIKKFQDSLRAEEMKAFSLRSLLRRLRKPIVAIPAVLALAAIILAAAWFFNRQAKIRWAREGILPQIKEIIANPETGSTNYLQAYELAEEAEKYIPKDSQLAALFSQCSRNISITSMPPGANAHMKPYHNPEGEWQLLGITPINNIRVPIGYFRWKFEMDSYETVYAVTPTFVIDLSVQGAMKPYNIERILDKKAGLPPGMVRVAGADTNLGKVADFFIDKFEVSNIQYKEFINGGGYRDRKYWKHPFIKDGENLTWEEAMAGFVDQTGQPGPSTWSAGDYPKGQEEYPVSGVSWYEAAAYAESTGKSLPTGYHWGIARGGLTPLLTNIGRFFSILSMASNFKGEGPMAVGSNPGMTAYGALDMAGNVREWCWNETPDGRLIRGGAWNDAHYMFNNYSQAPAFDRSPKNGFRCAVYLEPEKIPEKIFEASLFAQETDYYYKQTPVPDSVFQAYKEQFSYDKTDLNAQVEWKKEDSKDWVQEKIEFDAAYGKERVTAYLFLPKNSAPPFQTVIYFPGSGSIYQTSSQQMEGYWEFIYFLSFVVKNGRAAVYPIYKGTFERRDDALPRFGANTHQFTEYLIQLTKDVKRCIDYLETRPDIDSQRLAYLGFSWGGKWGAIIPAVEERIKASILVVGGLDRGGRPEANQINYVRHVKCPTLMLNGRYDMRFPYETSVKPMFDLLGTPPEQKKTIAFETDHFVPSNELVKETLAWLDRYLGPVR